VQIYPISNRNLMVVVNHLPVFPSCNFVIMILFSDHRLYYIKLNSYLFLLCYDVLLSPLFNYLVILSQEVVFLPLLVGAFVN